MDVFAQQRTHQRAALLAVSQLACLGRHTVTGLLATAGKQHQDWSADYRLFSRDRWDAQRPFDSVLGGVLGFLAPDAPLVAAMDDTLLRKTGPKIQDVAYRRDPLSPPFHTNLVRGQRFLQVSAMLPTRPQGSAAARAVPIRYQPAPPLPKASRRDSESQRTEVRKLAKTYHPDYNKDDPKAAERFAEAGVIVEEAHPDFSESVACAHVLRAYDYAITKGRLLREHRDLLKPEVIWNIEQGLKLTLADLERAEAQRVTLAARALAFFETYDLLLCPTTIVAPFPVEQRYLESCDGTTFDNYVGWLAIVSAITIACCPAISIPCGFTRENLPVGLQIVAPPRGEASEP